ncbi:hypothetical protein DOTSEDRAFT_71065 [Dothistroma septosporum NZE10]|uniref:Uncharacterized protein n=1 Tax=Dothistroma septosporum (strain NZE10 / CBS 128990) TaxID=675120 RepID=N1PPB2_DOTSN|nr:hypothetical protein DOTSEDRAFT_71065 [Dothistroma septosporum NZE10]
MFHAGLSILLLDAIAPLRALTWNHIDAIESDFATISDCKAACRALIRRVLYRSRFGTILTGNAARG